MGKELTKQRTQDREEQAWRLRVSGLSQWEVAERLGVSQPAVSKILARVGARLAAEFIADAHAIKARQSETLDQIAVEALRAWERSKQDAELVREAEKWVVPKEGEPYQVTDTTRERRGQAGDATLLSAAMKALSDQREIWGLNAPAKAEVSGPRGGPLEFRDLDRKIDRLAASLEANAVAGALEPGGEDPAHLLLEVLGAARAADPTG